jgi:hypothetical protein
MPLPPEELRSAQEDLAYHRARYPVAPVVQQLDETAAWVVRDMPAQLSEGLRRNFPLASSALPAARWKLLGVAALGLIGVNWLIGLPPATAQVLLGYCALGMTAYAGWSVLAHSRRLASDAQGRNFAEHSARLSHELAEQRIAALAALDQLAYDHPRYRRPLVHLLAAWLDERARLGAEQAVGHDCAVARQMLAEFWHMQRAAPQDGSSAAVPEIIPPLSKVRSESAPRDADAAVEVLVPQRERPDTAAELSVVKAEAEAELEAQPAELNSSDSPEQGDTMAGTTDVASKRLAAGE